MYTNMKKTNMIQKQMYLCFAELLSLRLNWVWSLIIVLISPLSILFLLYMLVGDNEDMIIYIVTGNMVMSLVTGTIDRKSVV